LGKIQSSKFYAENELYDNLNKKATGDQENAQDNKVWNAIGGNLGDYSDLYLKADVLAVACVNSIFRDTGLKHYELDPVYYYTAAGYSFNAVLKMTQVNFELLSDCKMLQLIEHGMRGGIGSICGNRYVNVGGKTTLQIQK
jgi:hypothetical protein